MKQSGAELLEFEALRELLGRYVRGPLGKAELGRVAPSRDRAWLEDALADAAQAFEYLRGAGAPLHFEDLPGVERAAATAGIEGAVLEPREILDLTRLLESAGETRGVLQAAASEFPRLGLKAGGLPDLRTLLSRLRGKILPDGSVDDDASPALHRLRRDLAKQRKIIQASLDRFLRDHREDGALREDFITIRNGRFVAPIVAGRQRNVGGVIHGASGSGLTLFVEPLETIDLNNALVRLREEEAREVHRILRELTALLYAESAAVAATVDALGKLELLFGKARFAIEFECTIPRIGASGTRTLMLGRARHPLLEDVLRRQAKPVTPVSLRLDEHDGTLLISGPNTGGKTVAMKTVGLLALMAHSGLPVPASEAEFPFLDRVLADIGDSQSIEESLSSFSAHISHVSAMLGEATPDSLVLLDELGRATDPEEGGALGVAILDAFRARGAFTIASTHLLALKVYGATTPGVVNGSMGFDGKTLEPTYVLRLGAPGKSAGLAIAGRLGLPEPLMERARAAMSNQERDLSRLLTELHERLESLEAAGRRMEEQRIALADRERALASEWEKRETAKLKELEARQRSVIEAFEGRAREAIEAVAKTAGQRKAAEQAERLVSKATREFQEESRAAVRAARGEVKAAPLVIEEGSRVRLRGIREPARVRRKLGEDRLEVEAGPMKMQVSITDVEEVLPATSAAALPKNVSFRAAGPSWDESFREINIIGQRAGEAAERVDKFLDSAAMASVDRVRIVHGHGMGILKKTVADLLSSNPHVEKFYAASPAEGGAGATIAELK